MSFVWSVTCLHAYSQSSLPVQQRLNNGTTPLEIYLSNNQLIDSLYNKTYQGGLIFHFDPATSLCLIALPYDLTASKGITWFNGSNILVGAMDTLTGFGAANTQKIVKAQGAGFYAAYMCDTLKANGYSDWYLPDLYEMKALNRRLPYALNTQNGNYWTSSESSLTKAWTFWPPDNNGYAHNKFSWGMIRPIRTATMQPNTCDGNIVFSKSLGYGLLYDIDSNLYRTVTIGNQTWMAENLRTTRYANGDPISQVQHIAIWQSAVVGAWCYADFDSKYNCPFGKLYNWNAVIDNRGLCPTGWHVPNVAEFTTLNNTLAIGNGRTSDALKGTGIWVAPDSSAAYNYSGLTALPAGIMPGINYISYRHWMVNVGSNWWTSTAMNDTLSRGYCMNFYRNNSYNYQQIYMHQQSKRSGLSIRCIKNTTGSGIRQEE